MLPSYFAFIGGAIMIVSGGVYLRGMMRGTVRPNRMTWLLWGIIPMIAFAAQLSEGVGDIAWFTFAGGVAPFVIFGLSFFKKEAYWQTSVRDYFCLLISLIGIGFWVATEDANMAITFSIVANLAASYPTLRKSLFNPETESSKAFVLLAFAGVLGILSIQDWNYASAAYIIYLFLRNSATSVLLLRAKPQRDRARRANRAQLKPSQIS